MTRHRRLGLLGGTFDPVHWGHLDAAEAARQALDLHDVLLMPAHDPPHRPLESRTSGYHRFALAALAVDGRHGWRVSDLELLRPGPSYSIDTLRALHAEGWAPSQIFFILGADACAELASWRAYPELLDAANFVVLARAGTTPGAALARLPGIHDRVRRAEDHTDDGPTRVLLVEARTRDVSSTRIRERLARGAPIDDLVPTPVARHIVAHHLYGSVDDLHDQDEGDET